MNIKLLTKKQNSIITDTNYPQYIRAGAGTGKTEVLINKILHILKTDADTSLCNFGIITFTNKAADELTQRLSQTIYKEWLNTGATNESMRKQTEIISMIDVCTIHGFCETLLREYGLIINTPLNFKIKSFRHETTEILLSVVNQYYDDAILKNIPQFRMIKLLDVLLTNNSNHGFILDENVADEIKENLMLSDEYWKAFKNLYLTMYLEAQNRINELKARENILTPNDLISRTVVLLQNNYIAKKVAVKYKYLFIDEFQDTNKDQFDFVNILIKNGVKIFLVGDDKQSIYAFRGADVENSSEMYSIISSLQDGESENIYLDENFRTDKPLLDIINKIFSSKFTFNNEVLNFPHEPLKTPETKTDGANIENRFQIALGEPIDKLIELIMKSDTINGKAISYGDIAILCRRNFDLDRIANDLKSIGYPVEVIGGKGFYKAKEIVDTYKLFNAIINKDKRYQNELVFTDYYAAIKSNIDNLNFEQYLYELETIFRRETVEEILTFIYEKSYIVDYYREKKQYQAIANLQKLKDISRSLLNKDNMQPIQFLDYLYIMINSGQDEDEADVAETERANGVIRIYSIHKAKGLSFPIVIVPCIDTKLNRPITKPKIILDTKNDNTTIAFNYEEINIELSPDEEYSKLLTYKTIEQLEEELRVFYVACTRAKYKLILSSTGGLDKVKKIQSWYNYASIAKWLNEIDNGKFFKSMVKQVF